MEVSRTDATVIGGLLKPDKDLGLPDETRVTITIQPVFNREKSMAAMKQFIAFIEANPIHAGGLRFTREELNERS